MFSNSGLHIDNYLSWHDKYELVDFIFFFQDLIKKIELQFFRLKIKKYGEY